MNRTSARPYFHLAVVILGALVPLTIGVCELFLASSPGELSGWGSGVIANVTPNAAICFICSTLALFLVLAGQRIIPVMLLLTVLFIALSTLAEYVFDTDIGIDQLFMGSRATDFRPYPGRMDPSVSFALTVAAIGLLFPALRRSWAHTRSLSGLCAFIVLSLGVAIVFGYAAGVREAPGWGYAGQASPHSGLALIALGIATLAYAWLLSEQRELGLSELQELVVVYSVGGMVIVSLLSFVFGVLPLHDKLRNLNDEAILLVLQGKAGAADEYTKRVESTALQITGRTRGRELLTQFTRNGDRKEDVLRESSYLLSEAMRFEAEVIGICRMAYSEPGRCMTSTGIPVPDSVLTQIGRESSKVTVSGPLYIGERSVLLINSPIIGEFGGLLGADLLLFSTRGLEELLLWSESLERQGQLFLGQRTGTDFRLFGRQRARQGLSLSVVAPDSPEADAIRHGLSLRRGFLPVFLDQHNNYLLAHTPVLGMPWVLLAKVDPKRVQSELRLDLLTAASAVLFLIALGAFGTYVLIRRLLVLARGLEGALQTHSAQLEEELKARKEAEALLDSQRTFLRQVIDIDPNFIFAKDREGRFTLINQAVADAYGTTVEELIGKTDADFNPNPDEVEHFRRDDLRVMDTRTELVIPEEVITDAQGSRRWLQTVKRPMFSADDTCDQVLGVSTDITHRKQSEERLREFAALVANSEDAILSTTLDGTVVGWNRGAERIYGFSAEQIVGKPVNTYVPEDRRDELRAILEKVIQGESVTALETKRRRADGTEFDVSITVSPIRDGFGKIIGASAIARDITQRKKTEQELSTYREHLEDLVSQRTAALERTQEQVRRSERLASIGALAAGIAHEINNPLGAITLAAQNAMEMKESEELQTLLERTCSKILKHAQRCGQIVKGVLQFSRQERTEKWLGDLNLIVKSSLDLVRELLTIPFDRIALELQQELPPIVMNPIEIEQIIINLVRNSFDSGGKDVRVWISTENRVDRVALTIRDNGVGMSEEVRTHMFDPFFTTRQQEGGTGLGLSIVHGIVHSHGGSMEVASAPGKGTTVTILIPVSRVDQDGISTAKSTPQPAAPRPGT